MTPLERITECVTRRGHPDDAEHTTATGHDLRVLRREEMEPILRPATETDFAFAFEAKKDAMRLHISKRCGWDENYQLGIHKQRWEEKPWFVVMLDQEPIGTVSIHEEPEFTRFGEFYLLENFRRRGLGSKILSTLLIACDRSKRSVRLEYS